MTASSQSIQPGSWLGVLGGGQLGRMFSTAAHRLGYRVCVLDPEVDCPAAQVSDKHLCRTTQPMFTDLQLVQQMSDQCAAITLEFENIASELVRTAAEKCHARPGAEFLSICQDRQMEKEAVIRVGCPATPFRAVNSVDAAKDAGRELGWPLVLKTARSGYDGKGQRIVRCAEDVAAAWSNLGSAHIVAEQWIDFVAEVSMLAARNAAGQFVCYPLMENQHSNHILDITCCPAAAELIGLQTDAEEICRAVAEQYLVEGLFCIEFFVSRDGKLLVNEMAPRPHNSGHLTIEAFDISQFEMQVRAVANLALRKPVQIRAASMSNLLGDIWQNGEPNWNTVLRCPNTHLHLYGKSEPRVGRKMGHITVIAESDRGSSEGLAKQAAAARTGLLG